MTNFKIVATAGQYLREAMLEADEDTVEETLRAAARYLGEEGDLEQLDDGSYTLGSLWARPLGVQS